MKDIEILLSRLRGINKWISENPEITDPNMYEITDMTLKLGKIAAKEKVGDMDGKYPKEGTELYDLYKEYQKMIYSRFDLNKGKQINPLFDRDSEVYKMFLELNMRAQLGEQPDYSEEEQEMFRKIAAVGNFIEQQKRDKAERIYDNSFEYDQIQSMYEKFRGTRGYMIKEVEAMMNKITKEYEKTIGIDSVKKDSNSLDFSDLVYTDEERDDSKLVNDSADFKSTKVKDLEDIDKI